MDSLTDDIRKIDEFTPEMMRRVELASTDGDIILRPYQINRLWPVIDSVIHSKGKTFAMQMPRQSGKSVAVATTLYQIGSVVVSYMKHVSPHLKKGMRGGVYGPNKRTSDLMIDKVKSRFNSYFSREIMGIDYDLNNGNLFKLSNGSEILSATASDKAECIEGPSLHFCIIEEAQAVKSFKIIKSIRPQLAAVNGTMLYLGSASDDPKEHGLFYNMIKKGGDDVLMVSLDEVFRTRGTGNYRRFVLNDIEKFGIDHPSIQSQYFGVWDTDTGLRWMTMKNLKPLRRGAVVDKSTWDCVVGIDPAKAQDSTVVTVMTINTKPPSILTWLEIRGDNYVVQGKTIKTFLSDFNIVAGGCDIQGSGTGLYDILTTPMEDNLTPLLMLSGESVHEDTRRMEFDNLKMSVVRGKFTYPEDDVPERLEFERQMTQMIKRKRGNVVRIDHPTTVDGRSDYPDSLRIAMKYVEQFEELDEMEKNVEESKNKKYDVVEGKTHAVLKRKKGWI
jgi:hypothetical protein